MNGERQFEILVVGRSSGDLVISEPHEIDFTDKGIDIKGDIGGHYFIPTDSAPSTKNDKVTSLIDLCDCQSRFKHIFRWGGGAVNSAQALFDLRVPSSQMSVTVELPSKPYLMIGSELRDITDFFNENNVGHHLLNFTNQNYNIVFGGLNKVVVRNKTSGDEDFKLSREHQNDILGRINPSDGILINVLNNFAMTEFIVHNVYLENELFYKYKSLSDQPDVREMMSSSSRLPEFKHRKVMTVVNTSSKISRQKLIDKILPFTGIIINDEDLISNFYGKSEKIKEEIYSRINAPEPKDKKDYTPLLEVMAQMRYGIPTEHGVRRYIEDSTNNIYVTLGKEGHLVAIGDTAYHLRINSESVKIINAKIKENKSSTNGAGDSFAAGVIHQETKGEGRDFKKTAAFANMAVCRYLGINLDIIPKEVDILGEFNLKEIYKDKNLFRMT